MERAENKAEEEDEGVEIDEEMDAEDLDDELSEAAEAADLDDDQVDMEEDVGKKKRKNFLHGRLEVLVEKARGLKKPKNSCGCIGNKLGMNPICSMVVAKQTMLKTRPIKITNNPDWKELFVVDVCHETQSISFTVSDSSGYDETFLGQVSFSVGQIVNQAQTVGGVYGEYPLSRSKKHIETIEDPASAWTEDRKKKKSRRKSSKVGWITLRLRFTPAKLLVDRQVKAYKSRLRAKRMKQKKLVEQFHPRVVPNTYFRAHCGDHYVLYQSSHQPGLGTVLPEITLGEEVEPFKARSCWSDLYHALNEAERFVCVCGSVLNPDTRLIRGSAEADKMPSFGELLKAKAKDGVLVYVLIWDGESGDEYIKPSSSESDNAKVVEYFKGSDVLCVHVQRKKKKGIHNSLPAGTGSFSHNQKAIIMDIKPADAARLQIKHRRHKNTKIQAITAFIGGLDIATGRFDDPDKTLFASLKRLHKEDFFQPCLPSDVVKSEHGPRLPWQDVHARVTGMSAVDILKNFIERWHKEVGWHGHTLRKVFNSFDPKSAMYGLKMKALLKLLKKSPGKSALPQSFLDEAKDQIVGRAETVLRLGDGDGHGRNNFGKNLQNLDEEDEDDDDLSEMSDEDLKDLQQDLDDLINDERERSGSWNATFAINSNLNDNKVVQVFRSVDEDIARMDRRITAPRAAFEGELKFDNSTQRAYVHHIRQAKHFVYIETEYFVGSCHLWSQQQRCGANNLVPAELCEKICEKIREKKPFHVYVVVPLFPKGDPASAHVQQILWWQKQTVEMMHRRISREIEENGLQETSSSTDYFGLYFLGNREAGEEHRRNQYNPETPVPLETLEEGESNKNSDPAATYKRILDSRRFMVYVHSKLMIVDDEVALIGSANINERSMSGTRDSELGIAVFESDFLATASTTPRGQVYGFRMSLWAEHLGPHVVDREDFDATLMQSPGNEACVRMVQSLAEENWKVFVAPGIPDNVRGHLMTYPYHIHKDGTIFAVEASEDFPDFAEAPVLGSSATVPNILAV